VQAKGISVVPEGNLPALQTGKEDSTSWTG